MVVRLARADVEVRTDRPRHLAGEELAERHDAAVAAEVLLDLFAELGELVRRSGACRVGVSHATLVHSTHEPCATGFL